MIVISTLNVVSQTFLLHVFIQNSHSNGCLRPSSKKKADKFNAYKVKGFTAIKIIVLFMISRFFLMVLQASCTFVWVYRTL